MIEQAPNINDKEILKALITLQSDKELNAFVNKINEEYLYWDKVKYKKSPDGCSAETLWTRVVADRVKHGVSLPEWSQYQLHFGLTDTMQRFCHEFDMNFGGSWENNFVLPTNNRERYLVSSLMEEAISSSQMEGASTTRKVAKDMLRKGLAPKNRSQQMIYNNYQTIRFIVDNKETQISEDMILHIHRLMTENTLDNPDDAGRFRSNDNVVVLDETQNEIVHTPPTFKDIPEFIASFCNFFNQKDSEQYVHPIIRGIILHYMMAYMHPFADGNGRTARAIFYWYMIKQGYWLMEYLSISRIIGKRKPSYEKAFLYAEACQNDLGYFIIYNLNVLNIAFNELKAYLQRKIEEHQAAQTFLRIGGINERQAEIIKMFYDEPKHVIVVKDLQARFSITPTTAKTDIVGLLNMGMLEEIPVNGVKKAYIKGSKFDAILSSVPKIRKDYNR